MCCSSLPVQDNNLIRGGKRAKSTSVKTFCLILVSLRIEIMSRDEIDAPTAASQRGLWRYDPHRRIDLDYFGMLSWLQTQEQFSGCWFTPGSWQLWATPVWERLHHKLQAASPSTSNLWATPLRQWVKAGWRLRRQISPGATELKEKLTKDLIKETALRETVVG